MIKGSCLCGEVQFAIDEDHIVLAVNCFCTNCRKVSGAQYGTFFWIRLAHFRWISGEENIRTYESSPGNHRAFCSTCGSRAPQRGRLPTMTIPGGALDTDPGAKPDLVLYGGSKASWCDTGQESHCFSILPPPEFWNDVMQKVFAAEISGGTD